MFAYNDAKSKLNEYMTNKEMEEMKLKQESQQKQIESVTEQFETIKETMEVIREENWRKDINKYISQIATEGFNKNYSKARNVLYEELNDRAKADIHRRLSNKKERLQKVGANKTAIKNTTFMDVIEDDDRLRETFTLIVKEAYMKYCG